MLFPTFPIPSTLFLSSTFPIPTPISKLLSLTFSFIAFFSKLYLIFQPNPYLFHFYAPFLPSSFTSPSHISVLYMMELPFLRLLTFPFSITYTTCEKISSFIPTYILILFPSTTYFLTYTLILFPPPPRFVLCVTYMVL